MATTHTQAVSSSLVTVTVEIDLSALPAADQDAAAVETMAIAAPQAAELIHRLPYVGKDRTQVTVGDIETP
jgi:hypothetical protein